MQWEVLYYQSERGDSPIEDFLDSLLRKARAKCLAYIDMLEEFGLNLPRSFIAKVRGDLWELRPEWAGVEYRFFYFSMVGQRLVIVHALSKKSQRIAPRNIALAESRITDVRRRLEREGTPPVRQRAG